MKLQYLASLNQELFLFVLISVLDLILLAYSFSRLLLRDLANNEIGPDFQIARQSISYEDRGLEVDIIVSRALSLLLHDDCELPPVIQVSL